jgi:hypothetical protein
MDSAGSVANCAYSLAKIIGMKTIAFVGQDLAYTGGVSHALGHQQREDKTTEDMEKDSSMKKVAGYYGDTVYTTIAMDVFKAWFEARFAEDKGITVLNCTEGGAMIKGAVQQPLQTLADEVLVMPDIDISDRLDIPLPQIPSVKSLFQKDLADINSVSQILSASLSSFNQVTKNDQDQKAMTKAIKMLTGFSLERRIAQGQLLHADHRGKRCTDFMTDHGKKFTFHATCIVSRFLGGEGFRQPGPYVLFKLLARRDVFNNAKAGML